MKFSISKNSLLDELTLLQGIVEKRNTMPILANVLVCVEGADIELAGTDLEVGLRTHAAVVTDEPGAITVNGKKLFEIIRSLPDGVTVTFTQKGDNLEIVAGESEFKVLWLPKEDYPALPEPKFERGLSLPLDGLKQMIDRVYYAITQEQRYYLNGALLSLKAGRLELVSTDGHRLSYTSRGVDDLKPETDASVIVAKKTLGELRKLDGEAVAFDFDDNNLFFRAGQRTLISRVIESKFPNYQAVIPKGNPHHMAISRDELANAIRRVALLSAERSKGIKFYVEKNRVRLFSSNPEIGEARDQLAVEYKGQDLEIGFNALYLLDFLGTVAGERVVFEIKDDNSAVLLRPEAEEDARYTYVLMPMKI